MNTTAATAFGRYLRALRLRRGLILQEVENRATAAGHRLDKGTVSRFERGRQRISVSSLLPLGRIYGVPFDALLERLELDLDAERGVSEREASRVGDDYESLARLARQALFRRSRKIEAYASYRDAQEALHAGRPATGCPSPSSWRGGSDPHLQGRRSRRRAPRRSRPRRTAE